MDLLPSEIFACLYFLVPLGLITYHWQYRVSGRCLTAICAGLSWIFCFLLMTFDPPDNGFTGLFYLVSGWFWMLPLFGLLWWVSEKGGREWEGSEESSSKRRLGRIAFVGISVFSIFCFSWGWLGQMSRERALVEARRAVTANGFRIVGPEEPVFEDGAWTVRYPQTEFKEIRLERNGAMAWIGSPG